MRKKQQSEVEVEGPGYRRMKARLGPERMEEMRLRTLREQDEALARAAARPVKPAAPAQDRTSYRGYPKPASKPAQTPEQRARARRVRIRQVGGDDGYQWCLIIDGRSILVGMTRSEAAWRRTRFIQDGTT